MTQLDRIIKIQNLLHERTCVSKQDFLSELEVSDATFKRDLDVLRDKLNSPIIYDRFEEGYRFDQPNLGKRIEIPGLWLSQAEVTALALMQHLLSQLDKGGIIGSHIAPLAGRIDTLLGEGKTSSNELRKRIKVLGMSARKTSIKNFEEIGVSLLKRQQINITYYNKMKGERTLRPVSPQQLIYYRENWYLDAYCHLRQELRSFALDGIENAKLTDTPAKEVPEAILKEHFSQSFGIFSGKATQRAKLRFSPERARYVSTEQWHPEQTNTYEPSGHLTIAFDFNQDPELIMDILKHGPHVQVLEPIGLKNKVIAAHEQSLQTYRGGIS